LALVKAFANPPQDPETEFSPSLKAALFVLNDTMMLELIAPKDGNLLDRLAKQTDAAAAGRRIVHDRPFANSQRRREEVGHRIRHGEQQPSRSGH